VYLSTTRTHTQQCGLPGGGAKITVPVLDLVGGQKSIVGSVVGGRADMIEMLQFAQIKVGGRLLFLPVSKSGRRFVSGVIPTCPSLWSHTHAHPPARVPSIRPSTPAEHQAHA
jgi:hypothetical protein